MDRLVNAPEHLDGPLTDGAVLRGNLRDLRRVNRYLGGVGLSRRACEALVGADGRREGSSSATLRILDIGTGGADIPLALVKAWREAWPEVRIVAVDSRPEILEAALDELPELATTPAVELMVGDGRRLPFPERSFDIAHASLLLHHLEPADASALLGEMARVSSVGIVVNDLARGRLTWLGAWLLAHVATTNRFTRHDGPLSVRRAYSIEEARVLIAGIGLQIVREERGLAGHRWALAPRR